MKNNFDKDRHPVELAMGDRVILHRPLIGGGHTKLSRIWSTPMRIVKILSKVSYVIKSETGIYENVAHITRLRKIPEDRNMDSTVKQRLELGSNKSVQDLTPLTILEKDPKDHEKAKNDEENVPKVSKNREREVGDVAENLPNEISENQADSKIKCLPKKDETKALERLREKRGDEILNHRSKGHKKQFLHRGQGEKIYRWRQASKIPATALQNYKGTNESLKKPKEL